MATIHLKRVYDAPTASDGFRVLVDRLWPRGVSKEKMKLDLWLKEVGPSDELRTWFNHDPARFEEFKRRYEQELKTNPAFAELKALSQQHAVMTLLYAAHDAEHNQAVVLAQQLNQR